MVRAVADTHTVIWYIFSNPKLSARAKNVLDTADKTGDHIGISSITLIEMVYLIEKGRIPAESFSRIAGALDEPDNMFIEICPDLPIARTLSRIDVGQIPDMPGRIIAATALHLDVPVISKDHRIQLPFLSTIW